MIPIVVPIEDVWMLIWLVVLQQGVVKVLYLLILVALQKIIGHINNALAYLP